MARARKPGELVQPPTRGPTDTPLSALLTAQRFRLGLGSERVAHNLVQHGGSIAPDAAAWIGAARPPEDAPSVGLGTFAGTLGPRSFGFVNLVGGVAPLDAPLPALPRRGSLALVVPAREALPDVGPLALARGLGLSWIVSVGDGDPAETIAFVNADAATHSLGLVLGVGASGASLRTVLGAKPAVVLGGDPLCRAVARRAGATVVDGLSDFLAHLQLYDAGVPAGAAVEVVVVGGGRLYVDDEVRAAGLKAEVVAVDERDGAELEAAVARAAGAERTVILVAGAAPTSLAPRLALPEVQLLSADLRHPEHLRALLRALAAPPIETDGDSGRARPRVDKELSTRVRAEVESLLSDHDAKRLLKAYGARVSRQAPTNTPTGAVKLAKQIGVPVVLLTPLEEQVAESVADVRRLAALMLQAYAAAGGEHATANPSVMVRERFPEVPRARVRIAPEKGLGLTLRIGAACALLPLTRPDALELATVTPARRAADQRAVAELLHKIATCAVDEDVLFELELYVGAEPAVVSAQGELRRR
jgi:hypothetical protein